MASKKKGKAEAPKATAGRDRVARVFAKAYDAVETAGNVVTQVCNAALAVFKGQPIPKADMDYIISEIARERKWSDASARTRGSEIRSILSVYNRLDDAIAMFKKKADGFTWHNAVWLARHLKNEPNTKKAVANALNNSGGSKRVQTPAQKLGMAIGIITKLPKRVGSVNVIEFRKDLARICRKHGVPFNA